MDFLAATLPATARRRGPHSLGALLRRLREGCSGERVRLGDLLDSLGAASLTAPLMVPALLVVSPLSGIPVFSSICGLTMAGIALQMILGRRHIWLPRFLIDRTVSAPRLAAALDWLGKPAGWIDGITAHRLDWAVTPPASRLLLLATMLAGLAMPLLEVLPFTSSILAAAVTLIALGLLVRDGAVALAGLGVIGIAIAAIVWLVGAVA